MKALLVLALAAFVLAPQAPIRTNDLTANEITGTWETFRTGGASGKTIGSGPFIFTLRMDAEGIKGGAVIGSMPGYMTVTSGRIEGDRIFLEASAQRVPDARFSFTGTIRNGVLSLLIENTPIRLFGQQGMKVEGKKKILPPSAISN